MKSASSRKQIRAGRDRRVLALAILVPLIVFAATPDNQSISKSAPPQAEGKPPGPRHGPRLQAGTTKHDFGTVQKGDAVRYDFHVTNVGDQVLEITAVKSSCGCTTAGEWTRTLQPGESGTIPIRFESAQFSGPVTKTITVTSNDSANPQTVLEINGMIWMPIQVSNPVVIFPALTGVDQIATRSVTIRNQVEGLVEITELRSDKAAFKPELKVIVPGKEFELMITTVPPLTNGTQIARISMRSSNPKMPEISVQAVATVLPPVQVAPSEIILTTESLDAAEKRYVVILNHRGGDLKLSDLKTNVAGVGIETNPSPDGRQFTVTLSFPAGFDSRAVEKMTFSGRTNYPELPTFEIPIVYAGKR